MVIEMEQWFIKNKKADFLQISRELGISEFTARLLINRNIDNMEKMNTYLRGEKAQMNSPFLLKDAEKVCGILKEKILAGKKIRIIGDYDVDGIMSVYILYSALLECKAKVDYEIPDRVKDGYGINIDMIQKAFDAGVDTIITCDNGISAFDQTVYAKRLGMTMIITDHHDISFIEKGEDKVSILPQADAVVNPKQEDCKYPFEGICGAVVVFQLVSMLFQMCEIGQNQEKSLLKFAAIATVCDVMDLVDENRILVKIGLKDIETTTHIGLRALLDATGMNERHMNAYHLGFIIGPCLNASGRLKTAKLSLDLLLSNDREQAAKLAKQLKELNEERKGMTREGFLEAIHVLVEEHRESDKVIVVYLPDCHESLAGIIAGRLKERYNRPSFVLTKGEKEVKGSGRSIEAYPMYERLTECSHLLIKFGGHPMAAGLSLFEKDIPKFRQELNEHSGLEETDFIQKVSIDMVLPLEVLSFDFIRELSVLEPFGKGNTVPLFAQREVQILSMAVLGANKNVIKFLVRTKGGSQIYPGILFQTPEQLEAYIVKKFGKQSLDDLYGKRAENVFLDLVFYPEINEYKERESIQIVIEHYR